MTIKESILIESDGKKVWNALVNPEVTKKYMFGCEPVSEWKAGSRLDWNGSLNGKEMTFVRGNINKIEPEKYLEYTVFDPNGKYKDIPENYTTVSYHLEPSGNATKLTVTQGDFSRVEDGEKRFNDVKQGWPMVLKQVKEIVESGN